MPPLNSLLSGFKQPQYYNGLGIKSKANPLGSNIQGPMSRPGMVGMSTPSGDQYTAAGIKASQPGSISTPAPSITPKYTASQSEQQATGGASGIGSYKGVQITPGSDADVAAQVAHIDATQNTQKNTQGNTGGSMGALLSAPTQNTATQTVPPSTGTTASPGATPSFPGIVGSLASQGASPYNQSAQTSIAGTQGAAQSTYGQGLGTAGTALSQEQQALSQLQHLQSNVASGQAGIYSQAIPLQFQQGRAQALQQMYGGQEQALAGEIQGLGSLYGTAATQQGTGISGLNSAAGTALTGQGTAQSALGTAGGLAQPQLGSIGQVPFSPTTQSQGSPLGAPGGTAADAASVAGQFQGAQAAAAAPGQAAASNINTQQTAEINALAQTYGQNAPAAYQLNNSLNNIQSLGALTLQTAAGGNINPLTVQAGNQTIADFRRQLGSPSQAAFDSNMANFQSSLTGIYADQSGAIPTQVTAWGQAIANGSMPLSQLQAIYSQAIQEGGLRLGNLKSTTGAAYSGLQNSPASGGSGSTGSGFGWSG